MDLDSYKTNITSIIAGGYITSSITIGKELGLFDALTNLTTPVSSQQLADLCHLKERYVREWLGCMVASKIVSLDDSDNYFIPDSCKPGVNRFNFAFFYPLVNVMTKKAIECFRKDGPAGYGYDDMPVELPDVLDSRLARGNPSTILDSMFEPVLTMRESSTVTTILDLGSGSGMLTRALGKRFPDATVYGADFNEVAINRAKAKTENLANVKFLTANAASLPSDWTNKFDWIIMFDVLHDLPCPVECMHEVFRVLKDDGVASIADPDVHSRHRDNIGDVNLAAVEYSLSSIICLPSSLSRDGAAGNGVGWGTENREAFVTEAGFCVKNKRRIGFECNFTCVKVVSM
ncbi:uncharacterized protein LOC110458371 [Mizuhopecten yessoensis]|uniref:uncharacterized protein LOC110458371 n=1 Tax=Mizuhopecten yessoensis TaxID=6573 RepID=UPI000B45E019|nr:uncharacterized protein LOC110458371 [Mizuhopecten yessoensis]